MIVCIALSILLASLFINPETASVIAPSIHPRGEGGFVTVTRTAPLSYVTPGIALIIDNTFLIFLSPLNSFFTTKRANVFTITSKDVFIIIISFNSLSEYSISLYCNLK
ncbi:hypothetical protein [Stygiolobus sp. RP850M]|uniref:hypothetical protein n=1 Tax=Stygiolobus sp. RP850M TaxID=3133137 RepID=UPI00307E9A44